MKDWELYVRTPDVNSFDVEKYTSIITNNDGVVYIVTTNEEGHRVDIVFKSNHDTLKQLDDELKKDKSIFVYMLMRRGE